MDYMLLLPNELRRKGSSFIPQISTSHMAFDPILPQIPVLDLLFCKED